MVWKKENIGKEEHEINVECSECHAEVMYDVESGFSNYSEGYFMNVVCAKCGNATLIPDVDANREHYVYYEGY